jgi:hypothetical protein
MLSLNTRFAAQNTSTVPLDRQVPFTENKIQGSDGDEVLRS